MILKIIKYDHYDYDGSIYNEYDDNNALILKEEKLVLVENLKSLSMSLIEIVL